MDEEIERRMKLLIERGEMPEEEGLVLAAKLVKIGNRSEAAATADEAVKHFLRERGVPSRGDFEKLMKQLDALADKVDEIGQQKS
jgi:polyhydroxyalkanoate synthesis regulator phasin